MTFSRLPFNLSPKLAYALVTRVVLFALAHYGIDLDPVLAAVLAEVVASAVGYSASPGDIVEQVDEGSDARLSAEAGARLNAEK